ncbi:MAG: hypothetical protein DRJ02_08475, partial [Bacteroidetes bacterium]
NKFLIPVLVFLVLFFVYSLWRRVPDIDDAWIGEHAYWFAKDGYAHSELMRGINHQEDLLVVHHKLFIFNGALAIKAFGFSVYSLKLVSLFYFFIFLILFYFYVCKWEKIFNKNDFLLALVILFSFPWIFKYAFLYRPEIMMMTLGFTGFILLENYIENKKKSIWKAVLAGMFFGLAVTSHLNGLILAAAGFFLLLWNRKYNSAWAYGAGVLVAFPIYFYDLTSIQHLGLWRNQFFNSPSLDSLNSYIVWLKPVVNLLNEHLRYFHNPEIIVFSIFIFVTLITGYKFLYRHHTNLMRFAILVAIITGVMAMHKSRQYMLLNFPYLILLVTLTLKAINEGKITRYTIGKPAMIRNLLLFLFIVFLAVSTYYNILLASKKFSPEQNRKLAENYTERDEINKKVIAPMTFIFNEIEYFNQIQGEVCYIELQKSDSTIFGEGFLEKVYSFDRDLIMITPYYQQILGVASYKKGDVFEHYRVIDKNETMIVFERKEINPQNINTKQIK